MKLALGFYISFAVLALFRLISRDRSLSTLAAGALFAGALLGAIHLARGPSRRPTLEVAVLVASTALCAAAGLTYTNLLTSRKTVS